MFGGVSRLVEWFPRLALIGRDSDASGNFAAAHLIEDFIYLREWAGCHFAADFALSGQGEEFAEIFAGAYGGGLDANFAGGHHDRREADVFGGQAYY